MLCELRVVGCVTWAAYIGLRYVGCFRGLRRTSLRPGCLYRTRVAQFCCDSAASRFFGDAAVVCDTGGIRCWVSGHLRAMSGPRLGNGGAMRFRLTRVAHRFRDSAASRWCFFLVLFLCGVQDGVFFGRAARAHPRGELLPRVLMSGRAVRCGLGCVV